MNSLKFKKMVVILVLCPLLSQAQMTKQDSLWLPFKSMIGKWTGDSAGQPGKGSYERSYEVVLNKKFIEVKNKSTYPPSQGKPKGKCMKITAFLVMIKAERRLY